MIIHKINPSVDYNSWLKRLDTLLDEPTYLNLTEVPKVKPTNKKILLCNLGTRLMSNPITPNLP